ncbi:MAG TPA: ABC transporter permease [Planctomycetes bacterium]|nr:ABC transporter permease [Planctomycetota bacterium]
MNKIFAIGRAEYLQAVRSKAFLVGVFLMPVMMAGSILVQVALKDQVDLELRRCAVVDPTGELMEVLERAVVERNEAIFETDEETGERKQIRPEFALERFVPTEGERADIVLSKRVEDGELTGFLILSSGILDPDAVPTEDALVYHTDEPTFTELPNWLESVVNSEVRRRRFEAAKLDPTLVARLNRAVPMRTFGLAHLRKDGTVAEAEEENKARTFGVPAGALFLLFILVMTSAPQLMNQVLEEKMQRISEVLVSAVTPFQLMLGKLLGSVGVCSTLALLYLGGVFWSTHHYGVASFVPLSTYGWFLLMMLFALLMYGSLFSALGSACSELRDAQSMMMPAMLVLMIPMFAWSAVLEAPNGSVATALTFFPTATPMILLIRLLAPPGPPLVEVLGGVAMCIVTTLALVWASGKIFRVGVLAQGQAPSYRKLIGWILSK